MEKLPGRLTVFFPCYNDSGSIPDLVKRAAKAAAEVAQSFEVVVVDDASTDGSREILKDLAGRLDFLRLVFHDNNLGYGGALRSGFQHASGDYVFYTDGDGQYDPAELPTLTARMKDGVALVNGYKIKRSDSLLRVLLGNLYAAAVKKIFDLQVRDPDCDFRLFRRALVSNLNCSSGAICVELVLEIQKEGGRIEEVPVSHFPRKHGKSQFFNWRAVLATFRELAALKGRYGK